MKLVFTIAFWLMAIGALNWGLVAFFGFDLVAWFSALIKIPALAKILYALIGISGVLAIFENVKK